MQNFNFCGVSVSFTSLDHIFTQRNRPKLVLLVIRLTIILTNDAIKRLGKIRYFWETITIIPSPDICSKSLTKQDKLWNNL